MVDASADLTFDHTVEHASTTLARKTAVTAAVIDTVELALEAAGGAAYSRGSDLERLFRAVHGARYHPLPAEPAGAIHRAPGPRTRQGRVSRRPARPS